MNRPAPAWTDEGAPVVVPHRFGFVPRRDIADARFADAMDKARTAEFHRTADKPGRFVDLRDGGCMEDRDDNQGLRGWGVALLLGGAGVAVLALAVLVSFVWQP